MSSQRTLEERILEKDARMQKAMEKARQYAAQKRQLERRQKEADRKLRTRRLIEIGASVESVLGREFVEDDIIRLMNFLKQQEKNGGFFSKAMEKPVPARKETTVVPEPVQMEEAYAESPEPVQEV